jgi:FAD/FMN-containing dehydrogenase
VARIMQIARDLGRRDFGEHGIGITKLEISDEPMKHRVFAATRTRSIPEGRFNKAS